MYVISMVAGVYLVATFTATGLAKLRRRKGVEAGILAEGIISRTVAPAVVVGLSLIELTIASLVATGVKPFAVGIMTASIFSVFCFYRLISAIKTGRISCSCAGSPRSSKASILGASGVITSSLIQAGVGVLWALGSGSHSPLTRTLMMLVEVGLVATYLAGTLAQRRYLHENLAS